MGMRRAFLISCILSVGCFKKPTQELLVVVEGMCVGSRVRGMDLLDTLRTVLF